MYVIIHNVEDRKTSAHIIKEFSQKLYNITINTRITKEYPKRIFVKRNGSRKLLDIEKIIIKYNFEIIDPDKLSISEQIQYFANADIVICPHGGNSTNCIYMKPKSTFIETFGNTYVSQCCTAILSEKEINYYMLVETPLGNGWIQDITNWQRDYRIDETLMEMTIRNAMRYSE